MGLLPKKEHWCNGCVLVQFVLLLNTYNIRNILSIVKSCPQNISRYFSVLLRQQQVFVYTVTLLAPGNCLAESSKQKRKTWLCFSVQFYKHQSLQPNSAKSVFDMYVETEAWRSIFSNVTKMLGKLATELRSLALESHPEASCGLFFR